MLPSQIVLSSTINEVVTTYPLLSPGFTAKNIGVWVVENNIDALCKKFGNELFSTIKCVVLI